MEEFTVQILPESGFSTTIHNNNSQTHHHKDQMLGAGSTPATPFLYELPSTHKPEIIDNTAESKSDYATFTSYIQQSTMLGQHRGAVDTNMDGVSLGSLCDLKFSNPATLSNGGSDLNSNSNYKNIPLLSTSIEDNHTKPTLVTIGSNLNPPEPGPSFKHLLFPIRTSIAIDPKSIQNQPIHSHQNYLTQKSTSECDGNYLHSSSAPSGNCGPPNLMDYGIGSTTASNNNEQHVANVVATASCNTSHVPLNYLNNHHHPADHLNNLHVNNADCKTSINSTNQNNSAENQITTTTSKIAITANTIHHISNNNIRNNLTNNIDDNCLSVPTPTRTLHNIDELAASSRSTASLAANNNNKSPLSVPNNSGNYHSLSNPSSESDCLSSEEDDEFIDMEISERTGYQDNTSSHSHQSGNGGGGGTSASNSSGVALLNGVGSNPNAAGGYMSLLPPAVGSASSSGHMGGGAGGGTSASAGGSGEGIDFKHLFEELCPVCGDKVSGYHYGLLTCESCKGFFKRTVQNKKVYTCVAERSCHIDKTQRKRCPYCRFQKCLEVGMKLEAVRADRMRGGRNKFGPMYKRDRARKLQVMRQRQLALQALRTSIGSADMKATPLSPGYQQAYPNMNIKQEIQIPQVSSLTQSPDSSPSPIAIALGQVNASTAGVIATPMNGNSGAGGGGNNNSGNNNNTTSDVNRSGVQSNCHDGSTGSLQNTAESKLCFDSGTHPSSTADSIIEPLRVSPMIRDFVQSIDDREWQTQLFALLQKQTYNQVEVDLFELMCKVLDQNLFSQVDWARNTVFFKDLKVDDQMKLLQHSWSDMLVLDHLHQRIHNGLPDETQLNNGQAFNLLGLGLLGVPQLADYFNELQKKLIDLKFDMGDYVCMKFLILLNPDVRGIINKKTVLEGHENVQAALLDYTLTCYPSVTDKFRRLLNILPDIHAMASRGEEHLYSKHCAGSAPTQTLLMEMLHAKRKV